MPKFKAFQDEKEEQIAEILEIIFESITNILGKVVNAVTSFNLFNPLPNDKILDMTRLKAFADAK